MKKTENPDAMAASIAALRADVESLGLGLDARLSKLECAYPRALEWTLCLVPLVVLIIVGICLIYG